MSCAWLAAPGAYARAQAGRGDRVGERQHGREHRDRVVDDAAAAEAAAARARAAPAAPRRADSRRRRRRRRRRRPRRRVRALAVAVGGARRLARGGRRVQHAEADAAAVGRRAERERALAAAARARADACGLAAADGRRRAAAAAAAAPLLRGHVCGVCLERAREPEKRRGAERPCEVADPMDKPELRVCRTRSAR